MSTFKKQSSKGESNGMAAAGAALYLIAGGSRPRAGSRPASPDPLLAAALRSPGVPAPRVAIIGAASGDSPAFRRRNAALLVKAGAGQVVEVPLRGGTGGRQAACRAIQSAHVVFFSGGDVEEGMRVLAERGLVPFLRRVHRSGIPFIGVSAGSIMLCRSWIRWTDPGDDASAELFPCLGLTRILCDTHGEGDAWSELKAMLALRPVGSTGYGIVTGAGMVVTPDGTVSALGGEVHEFIRRKRGVVQVTSLQPDPGEE
jgi:cyanophycinase-like exopeptidase